MTNVSLVFKDQTFWRKWKKLFKENLEYAIATEIGHDLNIFGRNASRSTKIRRNIESFLKQKKSLKRLKSSFTLMCKNNGILSQDGETWRFLSTTSGGIPSETHLLIRQLMIHLNKDLKSKENDYKKLIKEAGNQRRPRMPSEIAFQIVKLLDKYKNNSSERLMINALMEPNGYLDSLLKEITNKQKNSILTSLNSKLKMELKLLNETEKFSDRHKINQRIKTLNKQVKRIDKFKIRWNPFNVSRDNSNPNWINQVKNHLINLILSENEPKIIKSLNPEYRDKKEALLKELASENYFSHREKEASKARLAKLNEIYQRIEKT